MSGYEKDVEGVVLDYMPSDIRDYDGGDFDVRISLGEDALEDAFWVPVSGVAENLTLRQLLQRHVLGESPEDRSRIRESLDTDNNPDLPELYLAVRRAFDDMQRGKAIIRFHINKGPSDVNLDDPVQRHFSRAFSQQYDYDYRLIDLVLDVQDLPNLVIPPARQEEMKREFRAILLLYLMDRFGQDFTFEGRAFDVVGVEAVADWAVREDWLDLSAKDVRGDYKPVYVRTEKGNRIIRELVRETDKLIAEYDHFADVTLDDEPPRFRTGRGDDLRVWVYKTESIEPVRAIFLMNLENGFYDSDWQAIYRDDAFFRELMAIAGAACPVSQQKLDRILRAGKLWLNQNRDRQRRVEHNDRMFGGMEPDN